MDFTPSSLNTTEKTTGQARATSLEPNKPLTITITEAMLLALENNKSLAVQRLKPQIQRTNEQQQLAVFDPTLVGSVADRSGRVTSGPLPSANRDNTVDAGVEQSLPTGTDLSLIGSTVIDETDNDAAASSIAFGLTQSLLKGAGTQVNLVSVNQAKLDTKISQYELRGFTESLVAQIEETYWDYALAQRQIDIYNRSLELAQKQLQETQERISIGSLAQSEMAAAEAEVATRRELLINARSNLAKIKLVLVRLMNPPDRTIWDVNLVLQSQPVVPSIELDGVEPHIAIALKMRPELNQAKLLIQRNELDVLKTKNGLLPRLDLFITLGKTAYSESFADSVRDIDDQDNYRASVGLNFSYPVQNRSAQASHTRAVVTGRQAQESLNNLTQLVESDIRTAYLEIVRTQEQTVATAASRRLQEEKLRWETEKFRVGRSTSLQVAQVQRDLLVSQIAEVMAQVNFLQAFIQLYKLEGSLLERRGIAGPGGEPVTVSNVQGE